MKNSIIIRVLKSMREMKDIAKMEETLLYYLIPLKSAYLTKAIKLTIKKDFQ